MRRLEETSLPRGGVFRWALLSRGEHGTRASATWEPVWSVQHPGKSVVLGGGTNWAIWEYGPELAK